MLKIVQLLCGYLGVALAAAASTSAFAAYPDRVVKVIVSFPAGSVTDLAARTVATKMQEQLKQIFIMENRPGAAGTIADTLASQAPADGYTLLFSSNNTTINAALRPDYVALKNLRPLARIGVLPSALYTSQTAPFKTFPEMVSYAKANPGKLNYATAGALSGPHLVGEQLKLLIGIDMVHVPFPTTAVGIASLITGDVHLRIGSTVNDPRLVPIATLAPQRTVFLPDVPTIGELGFQGYFSGSWLGFWVPAGTPDEIVKVLAGTIANALAQSDTKQTLLKFGIEPLSETPDAFEAVIAKEIQVWRDLVTKTGLKLVN